MTFEQLIELKELQSLSNRADESTKEKIREKIQRILDTCDHRMTHHSAIESNDQSCTICHKVIK